MHHVSGDPAGILESLDSRNSGIPSRKKEKELLFLNLCFRKTKGKHKKGTAQLTVEGSFVYNCEKDKSRATEKYCESGCFIYHIDI